jgi:nucleotide-binding universal stress UspA family protein
MTIAKPYIVVVGVDYSEQSRLALREALRLASARGPSEVHVLYVEAAASWLSHPSSTNSFSTTILSEAFPRLERFVSEELRVFRELQGALETSPPLRVLSHIRTETAAREIAQLANDLEADLVVVGTHGRTLLAHLMLGSVAHGVVSLSPCPVLVVRAKHELPAGPAIEPPCPNCLLAREQSGGSALWCSQHREHHGQRRHTYFQGDRSAIETEFPLVFDER